MLSDIFVVKTPCASAGSNLACGWLAGSHLLAAGNGNRWHAHHDACIACAGCGPEQSARRVPTRKTCWPVANG